jgi:hypothetical protein
VYDKGAIEDMYHTQAGLLTPIIGLCLLAPAVNAVDRPPSSVPAGNESSGTQAAPPYLVGVYYFAGWWREQPNKYTINGQDWRSRFPDRVPTLGEYNEQATMDQEILAAADHGVHFFQILWYPQPDPGKPDPQVQHLDVAVGHFMRSKNAGRMKFTVEYCNHDPFSLQREADWEAACRIWCEAMRHPSYLRVDGRPVFKIHSIYHFLKQNGQDQAKVEARITAIRKAVQSAGLPDPIIGGGVPALGVPLPEAAKPYDFLVTYMDVPTLPKQEALYPYERLLEMAENAWELYAKHSSRPYIPYVPSGWDPRPWKDPRASFELPSRKQWQTALEKAKAALDGHPRFGIPRADGTVQKTLLIYAWNEFAEGGFLAPTRGQGTMKLEGIKQLFVPRTDAPPLIGPAGR